MKILLKGASVVNVFTDEVEKTNVLIENQKIIGVGDYTDSDADTVENLDGKYICPGFIDGHIHIESTMLTPYEFSKAALPHGTTTIIADPHEIANVCGTAGIRYMLEASCDLPLTVYIMLPSCVPASSFDESGANLTAEDLEPFYSNPRVLGLAEMMNYPGVIAHDREIYKKINSALSHGLTVDGHAPQLTGKALDTYIAAGIQSDHECSEFDEGLERVRKGQWLMIRQGTAARNLEALIDIFDEPYSRRCLLVTDDRHPADLVGEGHIDSIIRTAAGFGKSVITGIRMATIQAAQRFGINYVGAVAPGYRADLLVLDDLDTIKIRDVYCGGKKTVDCGTVLNFKKPVVREHLQKAVLNSFYTDTVDEFDFHIDAQSDKCRVIKTIPDQLLTDEVIEKIDFGKNNGIDIDRDILKIAVIERHMNTGHIGKGFISGIGLRRGAVASSVSHDSHNLIVIGTNDRDIAAAANHIISIGGGAAVVENGHIIADMPLPVAGLMTNVPAEEIAEKNERLLDALYGLGVPKNTAPLMTMAFVSLSVIPNLKLTTRGLVDVNRQEIVSLFID